MSNIDRDTFNNTHGKQVNGKFYTYQQLESASFLGTIKNLVFYLFLIAVLLFTLHCFYIVDVKKGDQREVIEKIGNYSWEGIVNGSIEISQEVKKALIKTLDFGNETGEEQNRSEKVTVNEGEETLVDKVLHFPVQIKNWGVGLYIQYIKTYVDQLFGGEAENQAQKESKSTVKAEVIKEQTLSTSSNENTQVVIPSATPDSNPNQPSSEI